MEMNCHSQIRDEQKTEKLEKIFSNYEIAHYIINGYVMWVAGVTHLYPILGKICFEW